MNRVRTTVGKSVCVAVLTCMLVTFGLPVLSPVSVQPVRRSSGRYG